MLSGWYLVALPPGSAVSGASGRFFTLRPGEQDYEVVPPGAATARGLGYWIYSPGVTVVSLSTGRGVGEPPMPYIPSISGGLGLQPAFRTSLPAGIGLRWAARSGRPQPGSRGRTQPTRMIRCRAIGPSKGICNRDKRRWCTPLKAASSR